MGITHLCSLGHEECVRSSELLDLDEGHSGVDLCLEGLRDEEAKVVAELLAVDQLTIDEVVIELGVDVNAGDLEALLRHSGEDRDEANEVVVAGAVSNGEDEVEETGDVLGAHGELLDLEAILAGDGLVGHLDQNVVDVTDNVADFGRETVEVELIKLETNSVGGIGDRVHVLLALPGLAEAGRVGHVLLDLSAESEAGKDLID